MKKSSLSYKLLGVLFTALCLSFAGCEGNTDAIEYRNDEVSYAYGETCVERYLFYEDKGIYERYIAGQYWGETLPGMYFGTLYETGDYELSGDGDTKTVTFRPKKQYDFEKKYLVPHFLHLKN